MSQLKIYKAATLPAVLTPSSVYFIKSAATNSLIVYLTDKDGIVTYRTYDSSDVSQVALALINSLLGQPNGIAQLDLDGNVIGDIAFDGQETSIQSNNDYVWRDEKSYFVVRNTSGGNNPTFDTFLNGLQGLAFHASTMNQVWCDFHMDHDIALNTKVYPHIHFMPTSNEAGIVRWGIEYTIAKGHGQQAFPATTTVYIDHEIPLNSRYVHMVAEVSDTDALLSSSIEPDTVIKTRIFRDAAHANDTYPSSIHAWQADAHYQISCLGTRNKAPNFYL